MINIKDSVVYDSVIKEFNYSFANVYVFKGYVVSEVNEGLAFNWDEHAELIVKDVMSYLETDGSDLIYISNRVNSYSVMAQDWVKFFKKSYSLKGYYIVTDRKTSILGFMVENLFFKSKIKKFDCLYLAINWAEKGFVDVA
ncbi:hypothetical protein A8C32_00965 [Flavivirga aquatica]|uniref:STAS/SEC14 domain-containing protein n=1 Tax=Flavivirga aquatica TaxID=1849968 RepID=A0A1E5TBZ1_9FLAO|nr:hypothetical protein [Flavivirga aquatica]OEK08876.1 hypothetical protein A8C32_00965 [Flavivirga aquatica]